MSVYPLRDKSADTLRTHSGRLLSDITAAAIAAGEFSGDDLRTHGDTLRQQAEVAQERLVSRSWRRICCARPS